MLRSGSRSLWYAGRGKCGGQGGGRPSRGRVDLLGQGKLDASGGWCAKAQVRPKRRSANPTGIMGCQRCSVSCRGGGWAAIGTWSLSSAGRSHDVAAVVSLPFWGLFKATIREIIDENSLPFLLSSHAALGLPYRVRRHKATAPFMETAARRAMAPCAPVRPKAWILRPSHLPFARFLRRRAGGCQSALRKITLSSFGPQKSRMRASSS